METRWRARRLKPREPNLGLIVVDYLQLMTSGASVENRVQEVSQISRNLKGLPRRVGRRAAHFAHKVAQEGGGLAGARAICAASVALRSTSRTFASRLAPAVSRWKRS